MSEGEDGHTCSNRDTSELTLTVILVFLNQLHFYLLSFSLFQIPTANKSTTTTSSSSISPDIIYSHERRNYVSLSTQLNHASHSLKKHYHTPPPKPCRTIYTVPKSRPAPPPQVSASYRKSPRYGSGSISCRRPGEISPS